eukprot:TRINITY_DN63734_c1_g1_i2.p1 TRINITY_DN63734_c1_g1~~TRINITY_DN63734_c1_g1_i2.p1  ORF type:complete len:261 (-),score=24.73 TRINITY_DN63734_c1_g1_i2:82-864(-)
MSAAVQPSTRILCMHGFLMNAAKFRSKMGSIRRGFKKDAEFVYLDAPHEVPIKLNEDGTPEAGGVVGSIISAIVASPTSDLNEPRYAWWVTKEGSDGSPPIYEGVLDTMLCLLTAVKEGPIHGIWGFSQGAGTAGLFLLLLYKPREEWIKFFGEEHAAIIPSDEQLAEVRDQIRFAILCCGFKTRDPRFTPLFSPPMPTLPTLHIMGESDQIIPVERSQQLSTCFANVGVLVCLVLFSDTSSQRCCSTLVDTTFLVTTQQ